MTKKQKRIFIVVTIFVIIMTSIFPTFLMYVLGASLLLLLYKGFKKENKDLIK